MIRYLVQFTFIIMLMGCVGEVETAKNEATNFVDPVLDTFSYQGIIDARAVAHDKIEVDFAPAGPANQYIHELYVNDSSSPILLQLETINLLPSGVYRYILKNLSINSAYKLKIRARDIDNTKESTGELDYVVTTFDNTTADFEGISRIIPIPGALSSSVKVDWNPGAFIGTISATSYDPVYYEVKLISELGGASNLNNPAYSGTDKQKYRVPSSGYISPSNHPSEFTVTSLQANTTYYFQVRAIHKSYNDFYLNDPNNIPIKSEENTIYLQYQTAPIGGVVDFNRQALEVDKAPAQLAYSALRANWQEGEGVYTHYRLYVKEFEGFDVENEDELQKANLTLVSPTKLNLPCKSVPTTDGLANSTLPAEVKADPSLIACFDIPTTITNIEIRNLNEFKFYQMKIALCRDSNCDAVDGATNQAILSESRYEKTSPVLAPFSGINNINMPSDEIDEVSLNFNAFVTSQGFVNKAEVYCVDPDDFANQWLFPEDGSPVMGGVSACQNLTVLTETKNDLSTVNNYNSLATVKKLIVKGITTSNIDPSVKYCFSMTPAITGATYAVEGDQRISINDRIVRCIQPELRVPTAEQFPGITNSSCSVMGNQITVNWDTPTEGSFDNYTIFYKERDQGGYNFGDATNGDTAYQKIELIDKSLNTYNFNVTPGKNYQVGILTTADIGSIKIYSQHNNNIANCFVPLPKATFKEWTRIFAIGPKIDGRVPYLDDPADDSNWPVYRTIDHGIESRLFEALSIEGIPYEIDSATLGNSASYYTPPPGDNLGAFSPVDDNTFDGVLGADSIAASKEGVISIAWKDVELEFLDSEFKAAQAAAATDRSNRSYGYRVYRSSDYGTSWVNLTGDRLIRAVDYSYRIRSNEAPITEKMGFFTDYSVQSLGEIDALARARMYLYKIIPVFNDHELTYQDGTVNAHNVIRVTLPPANTALVHRKMANRTQCLEIEKAIDYSRNYSCEYNGVGAKGNTIPWLLDSTVIDLGGDLLVDRFELACNYTRGDLTLGQGTEYKAGASFFDIDNAQGPEGTKGVITDNGYFVGKSNNNQAFRGCRFPIWSNLTNKNKNVGNSVTNENNPYAGVNPTYRDTIFGDCVGENRVDAPISHDTNPGDSMSVHHRFYMIPGAFDTSGGAGYDPTTTPTPWNPQWGEDGVDGGGVPYVGLYGAKLRRHTTAQADFGAVFYNRASGRGNIESAPFGPGPSGSFEGVKLYQQNITFAQNCSINLASIGVDIDVDGIPVTSPWRSRWFPVDAFSLLDTSKNLAAMTVSEATNEPLLYDDFKADPLTRNFKKPDSSLYDSNRIELDMPIGRIVASNSSKLPPLTGVPKRTLSALCENYKVQVGVANDSGQFSAIAPIKNKRLLRRNEFVLAAKNIEALDETTIAAIEDGADSTIQLNNQNINTCNGNSKAALNNSSHTVGSKINAEYFVDTDDDYGVLIGGSSQLDGLDNTASCISKFGVQDLAGNVAEVNTDELYCDYNAETMGLYFGPENDPDASVIRPEDTIDPWDQNFHIAHDAYICYNHVQYPTMSPAPGTCSNCYIGDPDADGNPNWCVGGTKKAWKRVNSLSGYCSTGNVNSASVDNPNNFRNLSSEFLSIFLPGGALNTSVVYREKDSDTDQESINSSRNGDAYFLNFGESNLGPSFKLDNGISENSDLAKYFNPIIGLPLSCSPYAGRESCGTFASDNKDITLPGLWGNLVASGAPGLQIDQFPIGNSTLRNKGVSETSGSDIPSIVTYSPPTINQVTYGYIKNSDESVTVERGPQTSTVTAYRMNWTVGRGSVISFFSGGSHSTDAGAYSLEIGPTYESTGNDSGGRCAVLVNEDY